jgi:hypothetical protein
MPTTTPALPVQYLHPPPVRPDVIRLMAGMSMAVACVSILLTLNSTVLSLSNFAVSTFAATPGMPPPWPPVPAFLVLVADVLALGLSGYLFVAGVLTWRESPNGAKLHWAYVIVKIPMVLLTAAVVSWFWLGSGSFAASWTGDPGWSMFTSPVVNFTIHVVLTTCLGLAYPILLFFMLRSAAARAYYASFETGERLRSF